MRLHARYQNRRKRLPPIFPNRFDGNEGRECWCRCCFWKPLANLPNCCRECARPVAAQESHISAGDRLASRAHRRYTPFPEATSLRVHGQSDNENPPGPNEFALAGRVHCTKAESRDCKLERSHS